MSIETSNDPEGFGNFEHSGWETVSQGYEQHFAELTSQSVNAILNAANVGSDKQVLDVCCGPGVIAATAVRHGAKATGIDFSSSAVDIARSRVPDAEIQVGDAQSLPFPDNTFDAVVCGFGIIHVPNPQRVLSEMYRVLNPSGRVAVSVWTQPDQHNGFGLLYGAIKDNADMGVNLPHGPDFFQFSDSGKLAEVLLNTGFNQPSVDTVAQIWEFSNPQGLITSIMEGAVRARALIAAQTTDVQEAISHAVAAGMADFRSHDGIYRVPMPALIGSAEK